MLKMENEALNNLCNEFKKKLPNITAEDLEDLQLVSYVHGCEDGRTEFKKGFRQAVRGFKKEKINFLQIPLWTEWYLYNVHLTDKACEDIKHIQESLEDNGYESGNYLMALVMDIYQEAYHDGFKDGRNSLDDDFEDDDIEY